MRYLLLGVVCLFLLGASPAQAKTRFKMVHTDAFATKEQAWKAAHRLAAEVEAGQHFHPSLDKHCRKRPTSEVTQVRLVELLDLDSSARATQFLAEIRFVGRC